MVLDVPESAGYVCIVVPDPMPNANLRSILRAGPPGGEDTYLGGNNFWKDRGNVYFVDELGYIDGEGVRQPEAATYTLDFRSALTVEQLDASPQEFSIVYSEDGMRAIAGDDRYIVHDPAPGSALTTYELADPDFYKQDGSEISRQRGRLQAVESELAEAYQRWEELEALGG